MEFGNEEEYGAVAARSKQFLAGGLFSFGAPGGQPQFAEFQAQSLPGDALQEGGLMLTPPGILQDAGQQQPIHPIFASLRSSGSR
jgi:hypothetical protein